MDAARRGDTPLAESFRKNATEEEFLAQLNALLKPAQDAEYRSDLPERFSTLHVVGVPRSGTTLLVQLITSHLEVGYVNNLIAAFWRAPLYGIRLSRKLLGETRDSTYTSSYGRTSGIAEPHEFGYFWAELLGRRNLAEPQAHEAGSIDWNRVRTVLLNITHEFQAPVAFKSFHLAFHLARLAYVLPKTTVVRIRRDPVDNALSLLGSRRTYASSPDQWVGLVPREQVWLADEPLPVQVAGQVLFLQRRLDEQIAALDPARVAEIDYDTLCSNPRSALERVRSVLAAAGHDVRRFGTPPARFRVAARSGAQAGREEVKQALRMLERRTA